MTQPTILASISRVSSPNYSRQEMASILLGPSTSMAHLWTQIRRLAPHIRSLLLTGEADCGQEAIARVLLDLSSQRQRSFISLSAVEVEARLLRSGGLSYMPQDAFLFLPDVDKFSPAAQAGLLHLMRLRRSRPFAVVACARAELRTLVSLGRFSPELADALSSIQLAVPSLRQRAEDLPMLLTHLLTAHSARTARPAPQLSDDFLHAAMQHPWHGNLGEVTRVLASLHNGAPRKEFSAMDLAASLAATSPRQPPSTESAPARLVPLDTVVQEHIYAVLRACRGNKLRASEILGISRSTLYRMLDTAAAQNGSLSLAS